MPVPVSGSNFTSAPQIPARTLTHASQAMTMRNPLAMLSGRNVHISSYSIHWAAHRRSLKERLWASEKESASQYNLHIHSVAQICWHTIQNYTPYVYSQTYKHIAHMMHKTRAPIQSHINLSCGHASSYSSRAVCLSGAGAFCSAIRNQHAIHQYVVGPSSAVSSPSSQKHSDPPPTA